MRHSTRMRETNEEKKNKYSNQSVYMIRMHLVLRTNYPKSFIQHYHAILKLNGKSDVVFVTLLLLRRVADT